MPFTVPVVEKRSLWAMIGPKHYCGSWAWFNVVTGALEPFFCGSGRCPRQECRKRFWRRRVILVGDLVAEYRLTKFYTLTMDRSRGISETWQAVSDCWNSMRKVLKRKYPCFLYVSVLEEHKDGYPHVHGFTNTWIAQEEWVCHWTNCGGGRILWVEEVQNDISEYVGKQWNVAHYVGKQAVCGPKERMVRRTLWRSTNLRTKKEEAEKNSEWRIVKGHVFEDGQRRSDGASEQSRKDLEGARRAIAEASANPGS